MIQRELAILGLFQGVFSCIFSCNTAKHHDVQQGIPHQPVFTMDAPAHLTRHIETGKLGLAVALEFKTAVLIMQRGEDEHRLFGNINTEPLVENKLSWKFTFNRAGTAEVFDHRGIEPDTESPGWRRHSQAIFRAFPDDGRRLHIPRFAFVDKLIALDIDQVGAGTAELFGDQDPFGLLGEDDTGGMVLHGVKKAEPHTGAVGHDQPVSGGSVMIGSHKILYMQATAATSGHHHRFGLDQKILFGLHIVEDRSGAMAVLIEHQFHRR